MSTIPHILHIGDSFDFNLTIYNTYPYNIQILSFGCKGFTNILFYYIVNVIPTGSGVCINFEPVINLKPKETKYLLTPDVTLYYKIAKPGIVKGEIQFEYYRNQPNINELDIQNISKNILHLYHIHFPSKHSPSIILDLAHTIFFIHVNNFNSTKYEYSSEDPISLLF